MNNDKSTLHFISGKLGSGKTTLAKKLENWGQVSTLDISKNIYLMSIVET